MRHSKLLEGFGLLLILLAWFCEWNNVREWNERKSNFDFSIASTNYAITTLDTRITQNHQHAVSRCFQNKEIDYDYTNIISQIEQSWQCAEVRRDMFRIIDGKLNINNTWRKRLLGFIERYGLSVNLNLQEIETEYSSILAELYKSYDESDPINKVMPTPSTERTTVIAFGNLLNRAKDINEKITPKLNIVSKAIDAERKQATNWYQLMFVIGSFLLVFAKISEWYGVKDKPKKRDCSIPKPSPNKKKVEKG
jgi:hypothetical protein